MTLKNTIKNIHKSKISFFNIKKDNNKLFFELLKVGLLIYIHFKGRTLYCINKEDLKYIKSFRFNNKVYFGRGNGVCKGHTTYLKDISNIFVHN